MPDESIDRYMTMELDMGDEHKGNRDSGLFARYSGSFLDKTPLGGSQSSDIDKQENIVVADVSESIVMASEMAEVESGLDPSSELPASLANMSADNVMSYDPPVTGGFLISFVVDARGGKMESSQTGIKIVLPPKSCQMPSRITCKLHRCAYGVIPYMTSLPLNSLTLLPVSSVVVTPGPASENPIRLIQTNWRKSFCFTRGNTYLTSLPLVSVHYHGRVNSVRVEINFPSSASSIFLVHNLCCF